MPGGDGDLGMLRQEVFRLGKQMREDFADIKSDLKDALAEIKDTHKEKHQDHETRIRVVEQKLEGLMIRVGLAGAAGAAIATPIVGAIVAAIAYALLHH